MKKDKAETASPELLTREQVMRYLQIGHSTLSKLMRRKTFPYIKLERKVLFKKSDIDAWLESKIVK